MLPGGANLLPFTFIFSGAERWQWKTLTFSLTTLYPWLFTTLKSGKIYSRFYKYFDFMHLTNIMEGKSKPHAHRHTYLYRLAQTLSALYSCLQDFPLKTLCEQIVRKAIYCQQAQGRSAHLSLTLV